MDYPQLHRHGRTWPDDYRCEHEDCLWNGHPYFIPFTICYSPNYDVGKYPVCFSPKYPKKPQKKLEDFF